MFTEVFLFIYYLFTSVPGFHDLEEINDYICVGQTNSEGDVRAVLFVKLRDGLTFTPAVRDKIAEKIDEALWRDLVPEVILDVKDIPVTCADCVKKGSVLSEEKRGKVNAVSLLRFESSFFTVTETLIQHNV
ncbi:UNVERIFIED_CONTAM: Acetoacetyl-CoA synthetase [Trichonephila clavipes]